MKAGAFLAAALLVALVLARMAQSVPASVDSVDLMRVFSDDEGFAVAKVVRDLKEGAPDPHGFYNYGYAYHDLGFAVLKTASLFGVDAGAVPAVAICLRLVSLVSFALAGALLFLIMIRLGTGSAVACGFTALFLAFNELVYWGCHVHPDALQTLFVVAALYALVRFRNDSIALGTCALSLGLAFGTKYSGAFGLIAPLTLAAIRSVKAAPEIGRLRAATRLLSSCALVLVVFVAAWLATNPYVLSNRAEFIKDLLFESSHLARGHGTAAATNGWRWFGVLRDQTSVWAALLLGVGTVLAALALLKPRRGPAAHEDSTSTRERESIVAFFAYGIVAFAYLFFFVHMQAARFLLHVWPAAIVVAAWGFSKFLAMSRISGGGGTARCSPLGAGRRHLRSHPPERAACAR